MLIFVTIMTLRYFLRIDRECNIIVNLPCIFVTCYWIESLSLWTKMCRPSLNIEWLIDKLWSRNHWNHVETMSLGVTNKGGSILASLSNMTNSSSLRQPFTNSCSLMSPSLLISRKLKILFALSIASCSSTPSLRYRVPNTSTISLNWILLEQSCQKLIQS